MAGRKRNRDEKEKQWVEALLTTELFDVCAIHEKLWKNERKFFCLDCHGVFCKYCLESHSCSNRHLTIYKNSHQNVVYVSETKKYFDCSRIQTYKINGEQSVHLNPKPSTKNPVHGDANPLTKTKSGRPCEVCGKSMNDKHNRYCSIACKVKIPLFSLPPI
ncbi:unnamed protein product [Linum tenue]|uniref:B box-type domain-containing protein n=1 Tax=Linum tenue TaxID=586396 RepID=A0AAV0M5I9_9ROSI|nr:unnamed protein product [Linum tenue]